MTSSRKQSYAFEFSQLIFNLAMNYTQSITSVRKVFFIACAILCFASSCKEESSPLTSSLPSDTRTATVTIDIVPKFGAADFQLNRKYLVSSSDSVQFTTAMGFISEICMVDTAGQLVAAKADTVYFMNWSDSLTAAAGRLRLTVQVTPGNYAGIKFNLGVPQELNHQNPANLPTALRNAVNEMWWSWNPGFIFNRMEGTMDSAGRPISFVYHIGLDSRNLTVMLASLPSQSAPNPARLSVAPSGTVVTINMDYARIFTTGLTPPNPLRPSMNMDERETHSFGSLAPLADRIFGNTQQRFFVRQ
jgi:hypothetical protein